MSYFNILEYLMDGIKAGLDVIAYQFKTKPICMVCSDLGVIYNKDVMAILTCPQCGPTKYGRLREGL